MIIVFIKVRTFKNELQLKILNALQVYHAPFLKKVGKFPLTLQFNFLT